MPSNALAKFEGTMMRDVDRIIETHAAMVGGRRGKQGLGHLIRGGVLLLCAAWELYVEEVLLESVEALCTRADSPDELPLPVRKSTASYVKSHANELRALDLAGDGWKTVYKDMVDGAVATFNTPKHHNIDKLFRRYVGLEGLSGQWSVGAARVDDFVSKRGDIAHRGADVEYILISMLAGTYKPDISKTAVEIDNALSTFIRATFPDEVYPWNRRTL
jgi:hypothetical protein